MRNPGAQNLRGRTDSALMYDTGCRGKDLRIRRIRKSNDVFISSLRQLVKNAVKQHGAFAENFGRLCALLKKIPRIHHGGASQCKNYWRLARIEKFLQF